MRGKVFPAFLCNIICEIVRSRIVFGISTIEGRNILVHLLEVGGGVVSYPQNLNGAIVFFFF